MGTFAQIGLLIVGTFGSLYLSVILLRFLFQLARVDFYNPISQFIVKATNPLLIPLRKIIPGLFGIDFASLILALLFNWLLIQLLAFLSGFGVIPPLYAITWSFLGIIAVTLNIYFYGMIIMIIASWIAPTSGNPILMLIRQLVDPITAPFRKILPDMGGIDLSPIFAFLAIQVCRILLNGAADAVNLVPALVLGI